MKLIIRNYTIFFLSLFPSLLFSQNYNKSEIDSLSWIENNRLTNSGRHKEAIELNKKILYASEKLKYEKGIAMAYINIGSSLQNLGKYKESLDNLTKAKTIADRLNNPSVQYRVHLYIGKNYNEQQISPELAIKEFKNALNSAEKIEDKEDP